MRQIFGKCLNIHSNEGIKLNKSFLDSRYENLLKESFLGKDSFYSDTLSSYSESEENLDNELEITHDPQLLPPPPQLLQQYYDNPYAFQFQSGILLPTTSDINIDYFNEKDFNFNDSSPIKHDIFSKRDENQNVIKENVSINKKNNIILEIEKENKNSKAKETPKKKCLGRKRKEETISQPESSSHTMYQADNISVKVQRHFFNFIICFLNCLLVHFKYNKKLSKLSQKVKLNIKKKNTDSLNDKTIESIVSNEISKKYKKIDINSNKTICQQMKNNSKLKDILSEKCLTFFKKFYYKCDSYTNILRDYKIDITDEIFTEDVKNFDDLLKAHEKRGNMYINSIKKVAQKKYLSGLIFEVNSFRKLFS